MHKILFCVAATLIAVSPAKADATSQQAAQQRFGSHLFIPYGSMLCGTAFDAISLRAADNRGMGGKLASCHASFGGWGEVMDFNPGYGTPLVKMSDKESGWLSGTAYTCKMYDYIQPRVPGAPPSPPFCH